MAAMSLSVGVTIVALNGDSLGFRWWRLAARQLVVRGDGRWLESGVEELRSGGGVRVFLKKKVKGGGKR
ncbi:unnamed protein product [Sphenostylis stenocarpa]|uniref:Uncharacterized protein n=1 Tax=Sphenostylis stenocarpa TaxID=92480 RepID=A0AA86ST21_9FABA|nr:unnamed protein product [Sphenostylis stenocarpa]